MAGPHTANTRAAESSARRNAEAVKRLFARQQQPQYQPSAHSSAKRRATSGTHAPAVPQATAAEVVGRTLVSTAQPAWSDVRRRELLRDPTHDIPSHVSEQLELAVAMRSISPEACAQALAYVTNVHPRQAALAVGSSSHSCFGLQLEKARHACALQHPEGTTVHELYDADKRQRAAYHHQQAVLRYEQTLARRRAMDPYVQLTAAQQSTSCRIPNRHTADKLVERDGGRFVLDNPHRQHLRAGVPAMTRVMRGEYYYPTVGATAQDGTGGAVPTPTAGPAARSHSAMGGVRTTRTDFITANKRHVRVTSLINGQEHAKQACGARRSRSAAPYKACYCAV